MAGRPLSHLATIPVDQVKGIGPRSTKKLAEAGISSVADLLLHPPRRYLDRSQLFDIAAVPLGEEVTVGGLVMSVSRRRIRGNRQMIDAVIGDGTNVLVARWFNPWIKVQEGWEVVLSGKVERFQGKLQMKSPDMERMGSDSLLTGRVVPFHPSAGGIGPAAMRRSIWNALTRSRPIHDVLPEEMLDRLDLVDRDYAIANIHFPETARDAEPAKKRLIFDELFRLELALALRKQKLIDDTVGVMHDTSGELVKRFLAALPYELTSAQVRVIQEIEADMGSAHAMHRLLQGEVGSGKTVVAAAALLTGVQSGYQGAVMAPTEVLAEQHYLGFRDLFETAGLAPALQDPDTIEGQVNMFAEPAANSGPTIKMALLTANSVEVNFLPVGTAKRADVVGWIGDGTIELIVGTHSLIQESLSFDRLGMAVVDEQHRFGVYQRVSLRDKAEDYDPDMLIMTATPIPRTYAMTLYGDLEVSTLDEMPPGRIPVMTKQIPMAQMKQAYALIREEVAAGHQAFVVAPLVDESDKLEVTSATEEFDRFTGELSGVKVGLMHGQLRPAEKDVVMHRFRDGEIDVLVATTVIEVGIDIPNATVMVILDADRFGLSQLHQLRGRVGRGRDAATCLLMADPTTDEGTERLAAMVATTDGFRLAEEDLRIRGQGTVFGTRQAGIKDLKMADILRDAPLLIEARREAFAMVASDPRLENHPEAAAEVRALLGADVDWLFRS
ncbi:MAG: ATP-dependent DNA helicase RecG [bacterium]|nr:ATP-dependent DNA helicase RecG [bacterium]